MGHGKRVTIHQAYGAGMEDPLGALGPVLNAIVLWMTKYTAAAAARLRAEGHEIRDEDIARLSPLKHRSLGGGCGPAGPHGALRPRSPEDSGPGLSVRTRSGRGAWSGVTGGSSPVPTMWPIHRR
ncbi:hypothetical protein Slala03_21160 [Streptomyces lavendulae subsp. lavendulae]|nr:hypothetical protein Slala03_21160 [Streptomyces lavendulae subsp. lavendulae]